MFAHIINNEVVATSEEDIELVEGAIRVRVPHLIKNPIFYKNHIIEKWTEWEFYKKIINKLIELDIEEFKDITKDDLYETALFDEDIDYIKNKRMFPNGQEWIMRDLISAISTGDFSEVKELNNRLKEEETTIENKRQLLKTFSF